MLKTRHIILLFIPAILIAGFVFYILVLQYEPLYLDPEAEPETDEATFTIPLLPTDPILGDKRAPKTVIVFEDLACGACRTQSDMLHELVEQYPGKVKVIWKLLSVTQFPYSTRTAHAYAYCANQQGAFDAFMERAFVNSANLSSTTLAAILDQMNGINKEQFDSCATSEEVGAYLDATEQIARALNIQSVPAIFIDNKQVSAPQFIEGWKTLLQIQ